MKRTALLLSLLRPRMRNLFVVTILVVSSLLATEGSASQMCGVNFQGELGSLQTARQTGSEWVRTSIYWAAAEDPQDVIHDSAFEGTEAAIAAGYNVMPSILMFAHFTWTEPEGWWKANHDAAAWQYTLSRWRQFWATVTWRYCASNPWNRGVVRYWSVWNEPNAVAFLRPRAEVDIQGNTNRSWCGDPWNDPDHNCNWYQAQDYGDLVTWAELGRRDGCPYDTQLVIGELAVAGNETGFTQNLMDNLTWNTNSWAGVVAPIFSFHQYHGAADTRALAGNLRTVLSWYTGYGWNPQLWATEVGGPHGVNHDGGCDAAGWAPYDPRCWAARSSFIRALINENRQYGQAYNWTKTFIFRTISGKEPPSAFGGWGDPGLAYLDWLGNPVKNWQTDSMAAACDGLFSYDTPAQQRSACYGMATTNSSMQDIYCSQIPSGNNRQMCHAMARRNLNHCSSITDWDMRHACWGMSSGNTGYCWSVGNASQRNICFGVASRNYGYCYSVADRNLQLACFAMSNGINSNCRDITLPNDRNFCYAVSARNTSYCGSIN